MRALACQALASHGPKQYIFLLPAREETLALPDLQEAAGVGAAAGSRCRVRRAGPLSTCIQADLPPTINSMAALPRPPISQQSQNHMR